MNVLIWFGIALLVLWLVLWLAVKITFAAIHLLVVAAAILVIIGIVNGVRGAAR